MPFDPPSKMVLGSPNAMTTRYFSILRRLVDQAENACTPKDETQWSCLAVFMSVTCLEAFLNIWCQTFTKFDADLAAHAKQISADVKAHRGVKHALKTWPKLVFGAGIDLSKDSGQQVVKLIDLRNFLMHYSTSLETASVTDLEIHGLSDLSVFESLSKTHAVSAQSAVLGVLREFFSLKPGDPKDLPEWQVFFWTGVHPDDQAALIGLPPNGGLQLTP